MEQGISRQWRTPDEVMEAHQQAFARGDLDALVKDYAENAVIITPNTMARGRSEIREYLSEVLVMLPPGSAVDYHNMVSEGDIVYSLWSAHSSTHHFPFGTDTFVIDHGMIQTQTIAFVLETR